MTNSAFINSSDDIYTFTCLRMFITDPFTAQEINSPLFKTLITIPRHFDDSLYMYEKTYFSVTLQ
jgi:hypothetical protein